jgi:PAS domain S-box-containing protein
MAAGLARAEQIGDAAEAVMDALQPTQAGAPPQRAALLAYGHDGVCRFVSARGLSDAYCAAVEGHCPWKEGEAHASTILVADAAADPAFAPYRDLFADEKIGSLAFIPLTTDRGVVGKIMLYNAQPHSITGAQVREAEGIAAFAGVAVGRILAMRRLEKSEARFRTLIEGTDVVVWEFDPAHRAFTYVSPQAAKFGYPLGEWLKPGFWEESLHKADRQEAVRFCAEQSSAGRNHRFQYRMHKADGSVVWVEDFVSVDATPGRPLVLRGVLVDITDRKLSEAALIDAQARAEAANRAKSSFLANMSHEIRTPLTAILGYADLLREDGDVSLAPQRRLESIDTIKNAGQHLLTVINDILDLSKIEADRMSVESLHTPLVAVLADVASLLWQRAAVKGVSLTAALATPVPQQIVSDPTRLRQILMNLAGNAVKFTESGHVTITARIIQRSDEQRLIIDVDDSGPGMTTDQAARLFAAFAQADATVSRQHGGTGLGLTISRRLARLMGGDVTLERTDVGRGSSFRLDLPLVPVEGTPMVDSLDTAHEAVAAAAPRSLPKLNGRILLAEDGPDNQRLIAYHLKQAGATVEIAENGRIALEMLDAAAARGAPYGLLLTDIQMPEMDGYALTGVLRSRGSTLAIVALTAHAMAEDRRRCTDAGCDGYATKPIDKLKLLEVCAQWLGRASTSDAPRAAA